MNASSSANDCASSGSSHAPAPQRTSMRSSATPRSLRQARAPDSSRLVTASLNRATAMPMRPWEGKVPGMSVDQQVAELVALDVEVAGVGLGARRDDGHAPAHREPVALDADQLHGIVGEHADLRQAEVEQDLRPYSIVAQVGLEAQLAVGFHGVVSPVLQRVGAQLVEQTDAPPF